MTEELSFSLDTGRGPRERRVRKTEESLGQREIKFL